MAKRSTIGVTEPSDFAASWTAFRAAYEQEKFAEALAMLRALHADRRGEFQVVAHEADLLGKLGDPEGEILLLKRLVADYPAMASLWSSMATAQTIVGRTDEAIASLRHAISLDPTYGKPWWQLSDLKRFRFTGDEIAAIEHMVAADLPSADRAPLHFALARAFENDCKDEAAFNHYVAGNALRAAAIDPRAAIVTPRVDRSIELFTADFLSKRADWGAPSRAPIFIVGLQRSGSTLVEQILASHPSIEGLSELPVMPQINRELAQGPAFGTADLFDRMAALDGSQWRALGQAYLDRAATFRRTDRPYFVDKLPGNWTNIGLIRLALPGATIIDARRHPIATGLSNFKQNYAAGAAFSYSLATIGRYYRDYLRLVSHFERVDPGAIHRVVNEALIDDFEPQVRGLLHHVGVSFDPACLDFHTNDRAVRTPSAEQVRRPINRDGVDRWRSLEPWLGPLKQALGPALDGWDLPPGQYRDEEE